MSDNNVENLENRSGFAVFAADDTGTTKDILTVRDEVTLSIRDIKIFYDNAGTTPAGIELYDDPEGTSVGNLTTQIDEFKLQPGENVILIDVTMEDIQDDIIAVPRNNDNEIVVSVGAEAVTG